eukprot:CAMPEP_0114225004 /NCGR_PEP_ID=MMETSP0058-20121206/421_1 /TAXON_ID=36894 /ORGANISM="Pyramimonas parkeae, CCMP726" /LENGTH=111 /DNA_ID=CAMNT_0001335541 /DNA_START=359 /DNA_END=692 /DNA_ORIENTATION=+
MKISGCSLRIRVQEVPCFATPSFSAATSSSDHGGFCVLPTPNGELAGELTTGGHGVEVEREHAGSAIRPAWAQADRLSVYSGGGTPQSHTSPAPRPSCTRCTRPRLQRGRA